jgi:hypothetical protein
MRLPPVLALLGMLALAACNGGVVSTGDVSDSLKTVYPLTEGVYTMVGSDGGAGEIRKGDDGLYRLRDAGSGKDDPLVFRVLAMPELPPTRYLVQLMDPDKGTDSVGYLYYFLIVTPEQITVLTPARYELEDAHLSEDLKQLIEVHDSDEVHVIDPKKTLDVLNMLAANRTAYEVQLQLVRKQ